MKAMALPSGCRVQSNRLGGLRYRWHWHLPRYRLRVGLQATGSAPL